MDELEDNGSMRISGRTKLVAVIGDPVTHSLSPTLLNAAFEASKIDWAYTAFEVRSEEVATALLGVRALGIAGLSVTMPHKGLACELVDECSEEANFLKAVNCIVNRDGKLIGYNTDGDGFLDALNHDAGVEVADKNVLVLGAGGAARSIVFALGRAGAKEVSVSNRNLEKASLVSKLAGGVGKHLQPDQVVSSVHSADLVINATSIGMQNTENSEALFPVDPKLLSPGQVVVDLVYHPISTPWVKELKTREVEAYGGLSMLIFQAARAFFLWTGLEAPVAHMRKAAIMAIEESNKN